MYLSNIKLWNFRKYGSTSDLNLTNSNYLKNPNLDLNFTK
jgi:putative ATP-dependent endonuclease of OLD family